MESDFNRLLTFFLKLVFVNEDFLNKKGVGYNVISSSFGYTQSLFTFEFDYPSIIFIFLGNIDNRNFMCSQLLYDFKLPHNVSCRVSHIPISFSVFLG